MRESVAAEFALPDEAATAELGAAIAAALPGDCAGLRILLSGELGAGKSSLARAVLRGLGHRGPVPSPTYTLIEPYETSRGAVYHVDLYRIADPDELEFLGFAELGHGLSLIEWPERVPGLEAQSDLEVALAYDGPGRRAALRALSDRGRALLARVRVEASGLVSS